MFNHSYGFALLSNCLLHMSCFTPGDHHPLCHRNNVHIPVLRLIVTRSGIPARPDKMTGQQPGSNKPCRTSQVKQTHCSACHTISETLGFLLRHPGTGKGSRWCIKWRNGRHAARAPLPIRKNLESGHCESGPSPRLPLNVLMQHLSLRRANYC